MSATSPAADQSPNGLIDPSTHDAGTTPRFADQRPRVPGRFVVVLFLALFGAWLALLAPTMVGLAVRIEQLSGDSKVSALSWTLGLGTLVALIANPLFGSLSDRCTSRFGARRPFMVLGAVGGLAGTVVIALAQNTWQIVLGWCIAQAMYNALVSAIYGTLADQVPERQMGTVSGTLALASPIGILGGTYLVDFFHTDALLMILVPALLGVVLLVPFLFLGRDRHILPGSVDRVRVRDLLGSLWTNPVKHPDFGWAWLSRFLMYGGYATAATYMAYYLGDALGMADGEITRAVFVAGLIFTGSVLISTVPAGRISDRIGRRKPIVFTASVLIATGMAIMALAGTVTLFYVAQAVIGLGMGVYFAVDIALPADVLPDRASAAKDLGVMNIAATLPSSLVALVGPALLALGGGGNYSALFLFGMAAAVLGSLAVLPVRRR
ncbi:MFS transporter [Streptomyces uncialis]|uniref:MFS transporter n=1 Tax=Streptomyces uncialis TaxID=1048205 RepID=UPI0036613E62